MKHNIKNIRNAILDMMSKVEFDKDAHKYTRKSDGTWLAGISSVASMLPKPFLVPWAAKETVSYLGYENEKRAMEMQELLVNSNMKEYQKILKDAKMAHRNKSETAKVDGTKGHEFLERYVKSCIRNTKYPNVLNESENLHRPLREFINWEHKNIKQWVLSEAIVSDAEGGYAGTLDGLAITIDDKLAIIDFKFANQIGDDYHLQTAGYSLPFKNYGIEIEDRIIVRLPKSLEKKVYNRKTRQYDIIENNIEIARSQFDLTFDQETFLHAKELYKYSNALKTDFK